jgi:hypothetical protein
MATQAWTMPPGRDVDAMPVESEQRAVPGCEILNSC